MNRGRFEVPALVRLWRIAGAAVLALALMALAAPGAAGRRIGVAMAVVLIAAPLIRVMALAVEWLRRGDTRFGLGGLLLVAVALSGGVIALLTA